ncbi:S1 family peptidase [Amycolatopsis sp. H20-H5]|uniref:S1 family peptidase n=1 Tax=Amycolatopsis sp. H20-H5 TaxID=3046309 RepID=UPI002DBB5CD2|nr:trypsin-like serine protease [Amycolatopsis sp. H20-H5]MEC3977770.1 trypsin-like serine protease [Amycolatopsis sp. H20-H5]
MSRRRTRAAAMAIAATAVAALSTGTAAADPGDAQADIVGGHQATGATPWAAAVTYDAPDHNVFDHLTCSGALVFSNMVVTAAPCVTDQLAAARRAERPGPTFLDTNSSGPIPVKDKRFTVILGKDRTRGETATVTTIVVNPGFDWARGAPARKVEDAAVLLLDHDVAAQTLPLASRAPRPGTKLSLYGFGLTRPDAGGQPATRLQQLETTVLPRSRCADALQSAGEFCTANPNGTDGPGPGDSGGPAVVRENGVARLAGICSRAGDGAGPGQLPTVYTDGSGQREFFYEVARTGGAS